VRGLAPAIDLRAGQVALVLALGLGDLGTGALLVAWPRGVERLLGIAPGPQEAAIWLRWIGLFVAAVGAALLVPLAATHAPARRERLCFALGGTAAVRLAVATFVAISVLSDALPHAWCRVGVYDAVAASAQVALLAAWRRASGS
jgi:hypothetical protein